MTHWMFDPTAPKTVGFGRRFVVDVHEQALLTRNGRVLAVLGPGAHRRFGRGYAVRRVDVRPFVHVIPTQEIPTADGVTVKLTVAVQARIVDVRTYLVANQSALAALHLAVQVALREVVAATTVDDLVRARADVRSALREQVPDPTPLGLALDGVEVKDIILPAELRHAQAQVLLARAEGQAALERARGEAAALRSLANSARLAADNPALLQLRLVQELGSGGHTVVFGAPALLTGERG